MQKCLKHCIFILAILDCDIGSPTSDLHSAISCLPISLGGAGIHDPALIWDAANASSFLSALHSPFGKPTSVPPDFFSLTVSSLASKTARHDRSSASAASLLLAQAPNIPSFGKSSRWNDQSFWASEIALAASSLFDTLAVERLSSLRKLQSAPGSGLWLLATPGAIPFSPPEWQLLLRARLGMTLSSDVDRCAACHCPQDPFGDHALSCSSSGLYQRHNRLRDTLAHWRRKAGWSPLLEQNLPNSSSGPADILFTSCSAKPVAVDVTVCHPLRPHSSLATRSTPHLAAQMAESQKYSANGPTCAASNWLFSAFAVESTGGLGPGAQKLCRLLVRALSLKLGLPPTTLSLEIHSSLSTALAKGRAEMLLSACPLASPST